MGKGKKRALYLYYRGYEPTGNWVVLKGPRAWIDYKFPYIRRYTLLAAKLLRAV